MSLMSANIRTLVFWLNEYAFRAYSLRSTSVIIGKLSKTWCNNAQNKTKIGDEILHFDKMFWKKRKIALIFGGKLDKLRKSITSDKIFGA